MSWTRFSIAACAALAFAGGASAETIVVRSLGPSAKNFPPGKTLPDDSKVTLRAGDTVTILDGRGTRVFKGPGTFSTTASTAASSSIRTMLRNTGMRQVRTGAVRGTGPGVSTKPYNVWLIDVSRAATVCVAGTEPPSLWSPPSAKPYTLTIANAATGKSASVEMAAAQQVKAWPAELPVANGANYRVSGGTSAAPVVLTVKTLGENPQGLEATASALLKAGCSAQLDLLVDAVAVPGESTTGG